MLQHRRGPEQDRNSTHQRREVHGLMSKLSTYTQAIAAEVEVAAGLVALVLEAVHECGMVVVHPRDTDTIGLIADQIDGARSDGLNAAETALVVLDTLYDAASGNDLAGVAR